MTFIFFVASLPTATLILRFSLREKGRSSLGRGHLSIVKFPLPQGEG